MVYWEKLELMLEYLKVMADNGISVSIISQGSSERGIGLVVNTDRATEALVGLEKNLKMIFTLEM